MTIEFKPLEGKARDGVHQLVKAAFLDGQCYEFAIALSRELGLPLVALGSEEHPVRHAAVYKLDHTLFDARGTMSQDDPRFGKPFGLTPPYNLRRVTEADLLAVRPMRPGSITLATKFAQILWPDLAWVDSRNAKMIAFLKELETLCRKHGVWIRAPYETCKPILYDAYGEEKGYRIEPTDDGIAYVIDRIL